MRASLLALTALVTPVTHAALTYDHCPTNAMPGNDATPLTIPNDSFTKICPGIESDSAVSLGQPQCGDGGAFNFYFIRPPADQANDEKLLIELQGGGACWDEGTCTVQSEQLIMPSGFYDQGIGRSCAIIQYANDLTNSPSNMLCTTQLSSDQEETVVAVDLSSYNFAIVPYCTQDAHMGDATSSYGVNHYGAHNLMATLNWVFANYPNLKEVAITGCSAGGVALPVVYDIVRKFYNSGTVKNTNINVLIDSAVILFPEPFFQNYYANWNTMTIIAATGFDIDANQYDNDLFVNLMSYIMVSAVQAELGEEEGSSTCDRWGFVTHQNDPISLFYYQAMGGEGGYDEWWAAMSDAFARWKDDYANFETFVEANGAGHCFFGLYDALQMSGFDAWAAKVLNEGGATCPANNVVEAPSTVPSISSSSDAPSGMSQLDVPSFTPSSPSSSPVVASSGSSIVNVFVYSWICVVVASILVYC